MTATRTCATILLYHTTKLYYFIMLLYYTTVLLDTTRTLTLTHRCATSRRRRCRAAGSCGAGAAGSCRAAGGCGSRYRAAGKVAVALGRGGCRARARRAWLCPLRCGHTLAPRSLQTSAPLSGIAPRLVCGVDSLSHSRSRVSLACLIVLLSPFQSVSCAARCAQSVCVACSGPRVQCGMWQWSRRVRVCAPMRAGRDVCSAGDI